MNTVEFRPPGVSEEFAEKLGIPFTFITPDYIKSLIKPRKEDAYKGMYGHALLVCGSRGMAGAAVLATGGALRSGCGLVTTHIPQEERWAVTANYPSALLSLERESYFCKVPADLEKYTVVGTGCGIGKAPQTATALRNMLIACKQKDVKAVIDADALTMIANNESLMDEVPAESVLTPHLGELKRLIGQWRDEEHKIELVRDLSSSLKSIVVVKGPNTMVCVGNEKLYFNSTGNSGMAKGGSGDILTGFITGLIARGYTPEEAAVLGVYFHGAAGDKARDYFGQEGMNSADIIDFLGEVMVDIQ